MGASMGIWIALIAWGAVLAFGIDASPGGVNLHMTGWILMGLGVAGIVAAALIAASRRPEGGEKQDFKR